MDNKFQKTITIRKIISNSKVLINDPIYNKYNPKIKLFNEIITYDKIKNFWEPYNAQREIQVNNNNGNLNQFYLNDINIQNNQRNDLSNEYILNI